jgi:aerobic-type carbon monoxide dehydrogenase small subunit (CoxS/CutS family)
VPKTSFILNGDPASASFEPGMQFLEVIREQCGIASCKDGCAPEGSCGCCAVLVDGQPVLACLRKPEQMEGRSVVTLEGIPDEMRRVLSEAFLLEGGVQCGFCIPGILVRAAPLLEKNRTQDRRAVAQALSGHLCRCTGYARILDAIQTAGEVWNNGRTFEGRQPRRHFWFGEEFGRSRDRAFLKSASANGIGASSPKYLGLAQALGEKPFVADLSVPGMLHGAPLLSPYPRAKVIRIHTSAAAAMPGVARIFTAQDVPGERGTGLAVPDLPVFVAI